MYVDYLDEDVAVELMLLPDPPEDSGTSDASLEEQADIATFTKFEWVKELK